MALTIGGGITIGGAITVQIETGVAVPDAPTIGTATAIGSTTATVTFTQPASDGGSTITSYTATSSPDSITGTLSQAGSGTITVNGLTPSTSYTFTVTATNSIGTSSPSSASNSTTTTAPQDSYFEYNTLLIPGNGTNLAQNNTFLDGSTNNFTITRAGNTTQGTYSPYGSNWSNYFDGNGDYLAITGIPISATGTFTFECWINTSSITTAAWIYTQRQSISAGRFGIALIPDSTGFHIDVSLGPQASPVSTTNGISYNTWNHIAVVRDSSNNLKIFINGVLDSTTASYTYSIEQSEARIGFLGNSATQYFLGYISNTRVTNTAVYSTTFTPSTTPLTAISGTTLLTCQNNRFIDNSTNAFAITVTGNTNVQRFSPFSPTAAYSAGTIGGSGYFDGTGDRLSSPANTAINLSTADFTIDCWVYPTSFSSLRAIITYQNGDATNTNYGYWLYIKTTGVVRFENFSGASQVGFDSTIAMNLNTWNHIAVTRTGTSGKIYINGVGLSGTLSSTFNSPSGAILNIGDNYGASFGSSQPYLGYMTDLRIVKGTLVYTSNFTPPTAPLTAITNTSLLLNYTNAGIIDNAMMNNLETVGNAQISTVQSKFGGSSMYFDGSGDWLNTTSNPALGYGTGNFTIEFWMYPTSGTALQIMFDQRVGSPTRDAPTIYTLSGIIYYYVNGGNRITGSTLSLNIWSHIAICRSGTSTKLFINGTQSGSTSTDSTNYVASPVRIGDGNDGTSTYPYSGYIDDLRITNGVARYTSTFTPPTQAFPTY